MDITLPLMPSGLTVLLAFFSPYAVAVVNPPAWPVKYKRLVALVVTVLLAAISMLFYYLMTGYVVPDPAQFIVLFLIISQAAYALVLKSSAKTLEAVIGTRDKVGEHVASER
jgi:hypothetical protein